MSGSSYLLPNDRVLRYDFRERLNHWMAGISYVYLLLTGLAFWTPWLFWMAVVLGGGSTSRMLHPWAGLIFAFAVLRMYAMWGMQMREAPADKPLRIGSFTFQSRLITGTGKYASYDLMRDCLAASGCEVTTVAVRRERLVDKEGRSLLDFLDLKRYTVLPNTAGCFSAEDAIRHARLARELLSNLGNPGAAWVKLECLGDRKTLLPDPVATLQATEQLVKD